MARHLIFRNCTILSTLIITFLSGCANSTAEKEQVAKHKKLAEINIELGMAYLSKKDYERAKQKFLVALEQGPKLPETWYAMGYFLQSTSDNDRAREYYEKSLALAPNRGDVQNNYGAFLCSVGETREAISHFNLAVKDETYLDTASAYENAGLCAYKGRAYQESKHYFELALRQDPGRSTSHQMLKKLEAM